MYILLYTLIIINKKKILAHQNYVQKNTIQ